MNRVQIAVVCFLLSIVIAPAGRAQSQALLPAADAAASSGESASADALSASYASADAPSSGYPSTGAQDSDGGVFHDWFSMVSKTQSEQPHWMTPVATVTPRLEQEYRYDIFWQTNAAGVTAENYGGSKGLEVIPWKNVEVIFIEPPYIVHNASGVLDGLGDFQILTKYRIVARNEESGNFILTAFFQVSFPTGQYKNGSTNHIITPTIAYGKGHKKLDLQGTFGVTLPTGNTSTIGRSYLWNDAFQYHVMKRLWPELEVNYTHFQEGPNDGKTQVFMTPGVVFGRFPIHKRLAIAVGGGFQIATTHFHSNNHNGIFTVRFPF
jgi:hypothetical protein